MKPRKLKSRVCACCGIRFCAPLAPKLKLCGRCTYTHTTWLMPYSSEIINSQWAKRLKKILPKLKRKPHKFRRSVPFGMNRGKVESYET